jgi:putative hydrolase of the HAD superfamily
MSKVYWLSLITDRRQHGPVQLPDHAEERFPELDGIRAVVFDVYGTLFSSGVGDISLATEENRDAAIRAVLEDNRIHISDTASELRFDEALHDFIHKHQNRRRSEGIENPEVEIRAVWKDFIRHLRTSQRIDFDNDLDFDVFIETLIIDYETRVNPTQPMPGLEDLLTELRTRGLVLSIISNAQFYTPLLFEAFLGKSIDALGFCPNCNVWSYAELEGKPSQRLYQLAAERLKQNHDLRPEQCLYVGNDMRNDIWPAQALGFRTALFAGDRLSLRRREDHPACKELQPDAEIIKLDQMLSIISPPTH